MYKMIKNLIFDTQIKSRGMYTECVKFNCNGNKKYLYLIQVSCYLALY